MTIVQISKMQIPGGVSENLPEFAEGEFGFTQDTGEVFLGMPNLSRIQYRDANNPNGGIFPYRNVKILTEFDATYTVADNVYYHGPLINFIIPPSGSPTNIVSWPVQQYDTYFVSYSVIQEPTATDLSNGGQPLTPQQWQKGKPRRMGNLQILTDGFTSTVMDSYSAFNGGNLNVSFTTSIMGVNGSAANMSDSTLNEMTISATNISSNYIRIYMNAQNWVSASLGS